MESAQVKRSVAAGLTSYLCEFIADKEAIIARFRVGPRDQPFRLNQSVFLVEETTRTVGRQAESCCQRLVGDGAHMRSKHAI